MAVGDIVNINNPAYQPAVGVEIIVLIVFRGNSVGSHGLTDGVSTITNYGSGDSANTSLTKTALKFGADFRVYDRGIKPGEDHAKWVVYPVHEGETLTWHDFSAKNRVAHSTKKRLLIGVVDDEGDVTYYVVKWMKP